MRVVIFAAGDLADAAVVRAEIVADDIVVAANGGLNHCVALGITPDAILGDLDSAPSGYVTRLRSEGVLVIRHPVRKPATDLELALDFAVEQEASEILVVGAMGGRWDQSLANLLLPAAAARREPPIRLMDGVSAAEWLHGPAEAHLRGQIGYVASLIPLAGDAVGITTEGLEYKLDSGVLEFGSTLGVSNVIVATPAKVRLESGRLLCVTTTGELKT
jgi:thiamine pyrophosphokinase